MMSLIRRMAPIAIVAVIASPSVLRDGGAGKDAYAISSLRAIASGEMSYAATCAHGGYAVTLDDLAKPAAGSVTGFISPDLATNGVVRSGYRVTVAKENGPFVRDIGTPASTCNGSTRPPATSFFASAEPVTPGPSGIRYFATDSRSTIYMSAEPIANPISASSTVVPLR